MGTKKKDTPRCGIDVGSRNIHVAAVTKSGAVLKKEFENTSDGRQSLANSLSEIYNLPSRNKVPVTLEATGKYSVDLAHALHAVDGLKIDVLNPKTARAFAEIHQKVKTDKIDARTLADWGKEDRFRVWAPASKKAYEVRERLRQIWALKCLCASLKNQSHAARASSQTSPCLIESIDNTLENLEQEITAQKNEVKALVLADAEWARKYKLMLTVPGIASTSALAALGELVTLPPGLNSRALVAFSGLDPRIRESGTYKGKTKIGRRGSPHLRRSLYLPALTAIRIDPYFQRFFQELKNRGKQPKAAVIAVERKVIHALHGMFQSNTPFDAEKLFPEIAKKFKAAGQSNSN
jgi:transposase